MTGRYPFYSIGHSNVPVQDFIRQLEHAKVTQVADIRTLRGSTAFPAYNEDNLAASLKEKGITYVTIPDLGGRRGSQYVDKRINAGWQNDSFHRYADYALSADFKRGLGQLLALGHEAPTAFMCAEAVWWRCHRRIVSDYLLARGEKVIHIVNNRQESAVLTPGATIDRRTYQVTYPALKPEQTP